MIEENELFDEFDETEETEDGALFEHYNVVVDPGQTLLRIDKFLSIGREHRLVLSLTWAEIKNFVTPLLKYILQYQVQQNSAGG